MLLPARETRRVRIERYRTDPSPAAQDPWTRTRISDVVASEEPMEIRVRTADGTVHSVAVTMRTPGDDFELAVGFLFTEGLVRSREEIRSIAYCTGDEPQEWNLVEVRLHGGASFDPGSLGRNFFMSSSCGICGKATLDAVATEGCQVVADPPGEGLRIPPDTLLSLPDQLRDAQPLFRRTGGIHAAGLFSPDGQLLDVREDVGRHNAVDRVVGAAFLADRTPLGGDVLAVSGRASFEILQKARMAGVVVVVAVGAPSSLAVDFARRFRMTLAGFVRNEGFNVYAGGARITLPEGGSEGGSG